MDDIPTVKFVYIQWLGDHVKPMVRAKISTHKADLEQIFHVSFWQLHVCLYRFMWVKFSVVRLGHVYGYRNLLYRQTRYMYRLLNRPRSIRPRTHGNVFLRFCIVYCSQGSREQPAHYLKQYKNAGKRFRV